VHPADPQREAGVNQLIFPRNHGPFTEATQQTTMETLNKNLQRFQSLGREMRLQLLLQYAKKFPELPEDLKEARDAGLNRVQECQTPLFLWVSVRDGKVWLFADVPPNAPTVRGFMGFLMESLNGQDPSLVRDLPDDLLDRMGIGEVLGIMRTQGLGSVIRRVKEDVGRAAEA
jgi:cysteine desulfuration protein SufE